MNFIWLNRLKTLKLNYNKAFVWLFWISFVFTMLNIIGLVTLIFASPSLALNVKTGDHLYLGFYYVKVGTPNFANISYLGIMFGIFVCINVILITACYWCFKNSRLKAAIETTHLAALLIISMVTIMAFFFVNVFNHPLFKIEDLDLIKNGWNSRPNETDYIADFNYVYSIHFVNNSDITSHVAFIASKFFGIWVFLCSIFILLILICLLVLFYNKNISISLRRNWGLLYV